MAKAKQSRKIKAKKPKHEGIIKAMVPSPLGNGMDEVTRRIDADALDWLYQHKLLTEEQFRAGEKYQRAYLVYSAQMNLSMDYGRERVDTSGASAAISDAQLDAAEVIKQATKELGHIRGYRMQMIAGEGYFIKDFALRVHGLTNWRSLKRIKEEWTADLDALASLWGIAERRKRAA